MSDEEHDEEPRKKKKGKLMKRLLTRQNLVLLLILIIGMLAGFYLTHNFVDAPLMQKTNMDYNALQERFNALEDKTDSYYACLIEQGFDTQTCTRS
ncbi:hypothetical protein KKH30_02130 [Candidatus Micrarchaeota archaeon]|nr:hypothetical protein [Candidatus Micrarchaeota archaeon]MBU1939538.1 hypothetical protein [Candidatus Micrarchaeota archaeon]